MGFFGVKKKHHKYPVLNSYFVDFVQFDGPNLTLKYYDAHIILVHTEPILIFSFVYRAVVQISTFKAVILRTVVL